MVYCKYCGEKNDNRVLKCTKCGKPLSLLPNDYPENKASDTHIFNDEKGFNKEFRNNYQDTHGNFSQRSIKSQYGNSGLHESNFGKNKYRNFQTDKINNSPGPHVNYYADNHRKTLKKHNKNYVEWDVVIATALLVIILAAILQRFFHTFGLSLALLIGLIYILTATKSKFSLFKAIPLAIFMVFTISAYFSL